MSLPLPCGQNTCRRCFVPLAIFVVCWFASASFVLAQSRVQWRWIPTPGSTVEPEITLQALSHPIPDYFRGQKLASYLEDWPVPVRISVMHLADAGSSLEDIDGAFKALPPGDNRTMLEFLFYLHSEVNITTTFDGKGVALYPGDTVMGSVSCIYDITSIVGRSSTKGLSSADEWINLIETSVQGNWEADGGASTISEVVVHSRTYLLINTDLFSQLRIQSIFRELTNLQPGKPRSQSETRSRRKR